VIDRGRLVALDTPRALVARAGTANLDDAFLRLTGRGFGGPSLAQGVAAMRPLWKLTVTGLKLFLREPAAVFFTLAFPLLLLWLNSGNGNQPRDGLGGRGLMDVLAPGFVAMVLAEVGLTSLPGLLSSYRERGILRRLAVTPVSPTRLLAAQLLAHLAAAAAGAGRWWSGSAWPCSGSTRRMVASEPDLEVVGEAGNGLEALAPVPRVRPDVALVDLRLPALDGVATIRALRERHPEVRVLVLTTFDTERDVVSAIEAGATGYLLKDAPLAELFRAVRAAARGETVLAPEVATRLVGRLREPTAQPLTERELQVLELVARGATNREVVTRLQVSAATVKTHLVQPSASSG
jgi:DNA-binding NarL/FixJ family response regulator